MHMKTLLIVSVVMITFFENLVHFREEMLKLWQDYFSSSLLKPFDL